MDGWEFSTDFYFFTPDKLHLVTCRESEILLDGGHAEHASDFQKVRRNLQQVMQHAVTLVVKQWEQAISAGDNEKSSSLSCRQGFALSMCLW